MRGQASHGEIARAFELQSVLNPLPSYLLCTWLPAGANIVSNKECSSGSLHAWQESLPDYQVHALMLDLPALSAPHCHICECAASHTLWPLPPGTHLTFGIMCVP